MSKDAKDSKHKPDGPRQPQRKDSLSSVLSWAALQGKITASKTPTASSSSPQPPQVFPGNATRPRRHSHSVSTDTKTKARRGSTAFRRLSFSISATIQDGASTKTRHAKTPPMTPDPKAVPGTSRASKNGSSEKVNKPTSDTPDGKNTAPVRPHSAQDKPRTPGSPIPLPKSILRISSPDGYRRPKQFVNPETGEPASPSLPPSSPVFGTLSPDSPPGSPPMSPIPRPMSPGATVRFAKATIHRVEVGPGRRFLPVKRKSKSTLTYIAPLDPGTQKSAPRTMLQSPTKMRRHQENQAAMGRYWLRTEEEEAQWRADAARRAEEEAERYRNEPASSPSPPPSPSGAAKGPVEGVQSARADKAAAIDKLPLLDTGSALDRVDEEAVESESEDSDEEAGAKCNMEMEETGSVTLKGPEEGKPGGGDGLGEVNPNAEKATEEPQKPDLQTRVSVSDAEQVKPAAPTSTPEDTKPSEPQSFFERLAAKQAAEERTQRASKPEPASSKAESSTDRTATSSGRSSSASTNSTGSDSSTSSAEQLAKVSSWEKEKAKEKEKSRTISSFKSSMNLRSVGSRADRTLARGNNSHSHGSGSGSGSGSNHLHLSGRRGRRYFEDHKQGITA
ncbi:hypothetical protein C8A00DRAFT_45734 [Chaetomidium leptoderma]|uniref:Uncharacterized protein n=1 Tax=Chaetomidium leptoderma TaxID=669021 RepID=A0AAN6VGB6_9PEZI|nr:hypothetical protein C8A00DRAFT_45734 [Chaetomidium leptoderma]